MKKVIFALAICATIVSCQKKEDTKPIDVSKTVYLMDKGWVMKDLTVRVDVSSVDSTHQDIYQSVLSCEKDNYLFFGSTSRVTNNEGNSKCDISAPDSVKYGYVLSNNDNHLYIFTNPDDPEHTTFLDGDMKYSSVDTFKITYRLPKPGDSTITQEFVRTYVKY